MKQSEKSRSKLKIVPKSPGASVVKTLQPKNLDIKYLGPEPEWTDVPNDSKQSHMGRAFNWYSYFYSKKDAKDMIAEYLDQQDRRNDAKKVRSASDSDIRPTLGWLCRMVMRGLKLDDTEQSKLDSMLTDLLGTSKTETKNTKTLPSLPRITIQDRLQEKVSEVAGDLEGLFDDFIAGGAKTFTEHQALGLLQSKNILPQNVAKLKIIWQRHREEFEAVQLAKDAQLVEAYKHFSKVQIKHCIRFIDQVIADIDSFVQIKKLDRKPRKKRVIPPEKIVAKFKYLKESPELKLKSVSPTQIIGASEVWLYDVKKRKLIYVTADPHIQSLTVKSSSILGLDMSASIQKTLRKPAEQLKSFMSSTVPGARKFFRDLKTTEIKFNGRSSENVLILKAK